MNSKVRDLRASWSASVVMNSWVIDLNGSWSASVAMDLELFDLIGLGSVCLLWLLIHNYGYICSSSQKFSIHLSFISQVLDLSHKFSIHLTSSRFICRSITNAILNTCVKTQQKAWRSNSAYVTTHMAWRCSTGEYLSEYLKYLNTSRNCVDLSVVFLMTIGIFTLLSLHREVSSIVLTVFVIDIHISNRTVYVCKDFSAFTCDWVLCSSVCLLSMWV